jgi:hypothetical protein
MARTIRITKSQLNAGEHRAGEFANDPEYVTVKLINEDWVARKNRKVVGRNSDWRMLMQHLLRSVFSN